MPELEPNPTNDPHSRYTIISVDGHAGAELREYKAFLASRWHDEFDAWAAEYVNPFADLREGLVVAAAAAK